MDKCPWSLFIGPPFVIRIIVRGESLFQITCIADIYLFISVFYEINRVHIEENELEPMSRILGITAGFPIYRDELSGNTIGTRAYYESYAKCQNFFLKNVYISLQSSYLMLYYAKKVLCHHANLLF